MSEDILHRIQKIVAERLDVDEDKITPESSFKDDLEADSLDVVELVMELEDEFDTEISDEDAENIKTVGDVIDYIKAHQ